MGVHLGTRDRAGVGEHLFLGLGEASDHVGADLGIGQKLVLHQPVRLFHPRLVIGMLGPDLAQTLNEFLEGG